MSADTYIDDDWPKMPDGSDFDGKQLLVLVRNRKSPFSWNVNLLIQEVEENLNTHVVDIPYLAKGSNNYGFHMKLSNQPDIVARLARGDINMPNFDGFPVQSQVAEIKFEAATYELLLSKSSIPVSRLLYHRIPLEHDGPRPRLDFPSDITGRRLLLFEKAEGGNIQWSSISQEEKSHLLAHSATIRASLFQFNLPLDFATIWLRERISGKRPKSLPIPVAPTREFCIALITSKIEATIGDIGDMIGWESDNCTVGPIAAAAKQSLLRLVPYIMPTDDNQNLLYRLVLEHGDFGVHNMSIKTGTSQPRVTSLYDWETGYIVPAILSVPSMTVTVDLVADENACPLITRVPRDATPHDIAEYKTWAKHYFKILFIQAPSYKQVIQAGSDVRHLWFALQDWRGEEPEGYFGDLGTWANGRLNELGV
ncbi:3-hydroxybutyryl-CoA dehydratase [Nemania sp. FL0031]|nr:3-hydroxybutyryl-CoA dehydratase [Nemania sp. FL0031]